MTVDSAQSMSGSPETPPLRAILEVEPGPETSCAVVSETSNAAAVTRSCSAETCHSEVTVIEGGDWQRRYVSGSRSTNCICRTLGRFECVFDVDRVRDGSLVVELVVPDRSMLSRIVDALDETDATVRLCRLSHISEEADARFEIDATEITEKQREAVELAVELGYYDRPRKASLSDLADELDISKSAVSQRLTAVELTLIHSLVED